MAYLAYSYRPKTRMMWYLDCRCMLVPSKRMWEEITVSKNIVPKRITIWKKPVVIRNEMKWSVMIWACSPTLIAGGHQPYQLEWSTTTYKEEKAKRDNQSDSSQEDLASMSVNMRQATDYIQRLRRIMTSSLSTAG